ncbi:unnamed protein product [Debaryomyces tyrocola]|nr:unnamed protein product [Debaryomyces tyrocola]
MLNKLLNGIIPPFNFILEPLSPCYVL